MPDIRPFRAVLYNPKKIKDFARVLTPPYDVISASQQKAYYRMHPYNIIRLILGKQFSNDNSKNNQYTRAHRFFRDWQKQKILLQDKDRCIYIYTQTFLHDNKHSRRTGFIVLLKLEDFDKNTVLPHENTFSYPVQDRLKLLKTVRANLSPIFAMFIDPQRKINKLLTHYKANHQPYIVIKKDQVMHRIWRMSDRGNISTIKKLLKGRQIFIADGHHRYEAALNYKMQMQKKKKRARKNNPYNYVMSYLVATAERGLTILPTHRAVKIVSFSDAESIVRKLSRFFQVQNFSASENLFSYLVQDKTSYIFGVYFAKNKFYALKLKNIKSVFRLIEGETKTASKDLDVTVLHKVIIDYLLNSTQGEKDIYYTRDAQEAIKHVDEDKYQAAFFLRPTTIDEVKRIARQGARMPHKSTYFYPKLLTGLVINKFNEEKS